MSQAELLALIVSVLNDLKIEHMLVGSHASSFYGEARSTHDVDLVIDLDPVKIPALIASFPHDRYYLSEASLREGRMANLIDTQTGDKVDCFILGTDPVDLTAFARRSKQTIMGVDLAIASAEDTILSKLRWNELLGGSGQQRYDIGSIIRFRKELLDVDYLRSQAQQMGLLTALEVFLVADS